MNSTHDDATRSAQIAALRAERENLLKKIDDLTEILQQKEGQLAVLNNEVKLAWERVDDLLKSVTKP